MAAADMEYRLIQAIEACMVLDDIYTYRMEEFGEGWFETGIEKEDLRNIHNVVVANKDIVDRIVCEREFMAQLRLAESLVCDSCGAPCRPMDPSWRRCGEWQHSCPGLIAQAGHIGKGVVKP